MTATAAAAHDIARDAEEARLRDFVLYSYRSIASDVLDGRGVWLETTSSFFRADCRAVAAGDTVPWLRSLLVDAPSAAAFARALVVARHLQRRAPGEEVPSPESCSCLDADRVKP